MSIAVSNLTPVWLAFSLLLGGLLWSCRPFTGAVPAGPATQPSQAEGDTKEGYPAMPDGLLTSPDTNATISPPSSPEVYYRTLVNVAFDDTTSALTVRRILAHFGTVVGGNKAAGPRGTYVLQVADRGVDWSRVTAMLDSLKNEGGVAAAGLLPAQPKP